MSSEIENIIKKLEENKFKVRCGEIENYFERMMLLKAQANKAIKVAPEYVNLIINYIEDCENLVEKYYNIINEEVVKQCLK